MLMLNFHFSRITAPSHLLLTNTVKKAYNGTVKVITNPKPCFICIYGFNQECELLIVRIKLNKNDVSDVKCKFNSTFTRSFLISSKTDRFTLEFQINK